MHGGTEHGSLSCLVLPHRDLGAFFLFENDHNRRRCRQLVIVALDQCIDLVFELTCLLKFLLCNRLAPLLQQFNHGSIPATERQVGHFDAL